VTGIVVGRMGEPVFNPKRDSDSIKKNMLSQTFLCL